MLRRLPKIALTAVLMTQVVSLASVAADKVKNAPLAARAPVETSDDVAAEKEWNKWLLTFENVTREIYNQRSAIIKALELKPGMDVADIGSGTGFYTFLMAKEVAPNGDIYAVDINKAFLKHIEQKAREQGIKQMHTVVCSKKSVGLPSNSVDLAFVCDTYHYLEYPQSTLVSINKALRKNGKLVIIDIDRRPDKSSEWVMKNVRTGKKEFIAEIEAAGFKKVKEENFLKENFMATFVKAPAKK
ncbi:MAG: class I SAM-dependent methyltransferase [Candidatus Obscuribacterales bacterium]|nr:class I SAM-dependent methyltransferase [Candidatus Obscuribacterales bacterium]